MTDETWPPNVNIGFSFPLFHIYTLLVSSLAQYKSQSGLDKVADTNFSFDELVVSSKLLNNTHT